MIDGRWGLTINTPIGQKFLDLDLKVSGNEAFGTLTGESNSGVQIANGAVDGDRVTYSAFLNTPAGSTNTSTTLNVSGDSMSGNISTSFGTFSVNGVRK